jgi:hypothetical protein
MDPALLKGITAKGNLIVVAREVWADKSRRQPVKPKPAS